jgi:3-methyladenine DNA glycosylase AlkD
MELKQILAKLKSMSNPDAIVGMARFGINPDNTYGITIPQLLELAKKTGKDHQLAKALWQSGIRDARILACMIDDPQAVTEKQLENWVKDFDSWDVCDQCCNRLFQKTNFAYQKALEWVDRKEEFVKRAGFVLMCTIAVHHKKLDDGQFDPFFELIKREAADERNFVLKAVNWALRQIGKRNRALNKKAVALAGEIQQIDSKAARWIAADALRELTSEKIRKRLGG